MYSLMSCFTSVLSLCYTLLPPWSHLTAVPESVKPRLWSEIVPFFPQVFLLGILSRQKGSTDEDKQYQEGGADAAAVGNVTLVKQCAEGI